MRRIFPAMITVLGFLFAGILALSPVRAAGVSLSKGNLLLDGNLELASGKAVTDGVILMVHGTMAHNRMEIMASLQELLKERGLSTLAITLSLNISARRGMQDCARGHTHRHTDAIDEIGAWLGWLKEQGVEKVTLLGHSRGGNQVAWLAAEGRYENFVRLVLVAPGSFSSASQISSYRNRYGVDLPPLLEKAEAMVKFGDGNDFVGGVSFLGCTDAKVSALSFLSYYQGGKYSDLTDSLPMVKKPVLVVVGSADTVVPGIPAKLAPIASPNLDVQVIEDAGHFFRDLYGDDLADAIAGFIGE